MSVEVATLQSTGPPIIQPRVGNARLAKLCVVACDIVVIACGIALASLLRSGFHSDAATLPDRQLVVSVVSLPIWVMLFFHYRLYSSRNVASRMEEFGRLLHAVIASVMGMAVISFAFQLYVRRTWLVLTLFVTLPLLTAQREIVRRVFRALHRRGRHLRTVVIVGTNAEAISLFQLLSMSPWLGYSVVGFADDSLPVGTTVCDGKKVLCRVSDTLQVARETGVGGVVVATTAVSADLSNRLARQLIEAGLHYELTSSLSDVAAERLTVRPLGRSPVIYVEPTRCRGWRGSAKRAFDVSLAGSLLIVLPPVFLAVALAIRVDSPGPVFFRQTRVGRGGRTFRLWKFRTMVTEAEELLAELRERNEAEGPLFKIRDDPRVTRVGRLLRRYSLDELPQLWNVLKGDMSLVGPRPALPSEVLRWLPELHSRLRVRPGLTGMWQVNGRSHCSFTDYVSLDLYYVENWTLWADLAIIAKTFPSVLIRRGAY